MYLNKKEFVQEVARRCMLTEYVVEEIFNVSSGLIAEKLIGNETVDIPKCGKFVLKERKASTYKNLCGVNELSIDKIIYPSFQVCGDLKNRVKNGHKYKKVT